jgi:hypothetical protein
MASRVSRQRAWRGFRRWWACRVARRGRRLGASRGSVSAIAVGAGAAAASYTAETAGTKNFSWKGLATSTAIGAAAGALTFGAVSAGGAVVSRIASAEATAVASEEVATVAATEATSTAAVAEVETVTGNSARTIADESGQVKSFDSFAKAKAELGTNPGEDIHHIVEQCQCNAARSGFSPQEVNSTDNLIRLPGEVHDQISAYYSSRPPGFSTTVRNSLNGLPWQDQYDFGMDVVRRVLRGPF